MSNEHEGKRFVMPVEGCKPRHPELGRNIAREGEWILDSPRLRKFMRDGDVVETTPPAPKAKKGA